MARAIRTADAETFIKKLPPHTWDSATAVAYEATQELVNDVIGCYVALLNRERRRPRPAPEQIRHIREQIAACDQAQRTLDPDDAAGIEALRASYRPRLQQLRAELSER